MWGGFPKCKQILAAISSFDGVGNQNSSPSTKKKNPFILLSRANLNLCSRNSYPYTNKGMRKLSRRKEPRWSLRINRPNPTSEWRARSCIGSHPNRLTCPPEERRGSGFGTATFFSFCFWGGGPKGTALLNRRIGDDPPPPTQAIVHFHTVSIKTRGKS